MQWRHGSISGRQLVYEEVGRQIRAKREQEEKEQACEVCGRQKVMEQEAEGVWLLVCSYKHHPPTKEEGVQRS